MSTQKTTPLAMGCAVLVIGFLCLWLLGLFVSISIPKSDRSSTSRHDHKYNAVFSSWDGSNAALVKHVKNGMNDPNSFQHVETRFVEKPDHYFVNMTYRGRNGFGGVVTEEIWADIDRQGQLISVTSPEQMLSEIFAARDTAAKTLPEVPRNNRNIDKPTPEFTPHVVNAPVVSALEARKEESRWRIWTSKDGSKRAEAKFKSFANGNATLEKRDGTTLTIPVDLLIDGDLDFIVERRWED